MKIWLDSEFIEDGRTIDLISIGMVREDGRELYLENIDTDWTKANEWVLANVKPHLGPAGERFGRDEIADRVLDFVDSGTASPGFWAYYASYDWIVLCQLFGTMMDLPKGWPMFVRDLRQMLDDYGNPRLPEQTGAVHHALADARWVRDSYVWLKTKQWKR